MKYTTQIDSIGLRVEFSSSGLQRSRLKEMLSLIMSIDTFYVNSIEQKFGNGGLRIKHEIYSNSTTMATIITGSYPVGKNRKRSIYFIKILFAGLKSYDNDIDELRDNFLLYLCSWINTKRLSFKICELDCDIDVNCDYKNFHVMQIKKVPNGRYNTEQVFQTTHYLQKKTKSLSAFFYDKQIKEELDNKMSRFELKFPSKFFTNKDDLELLDIDISRVFDRYAVFYFEDKELKKEVIDAQNHIEKSDKRYRGRAYNKLMLQLNEYRLLPDIHYIMDFIFNLYSVKNHKMVIKKDRKTRYSMLSNDLFDFDESFGL